MRKIIITESQYKNAVLISDKRRGLLNEIKTSIRGNVPLLNEFHTNNAARHLLNGGLNGFYNYLFEADLIDMVKSQCLLSFSKGNAKLDNTLLFSLPAGWTCPFAEKCLKKVSRDRKIDPEKVGTMVNGKPYTGEVEWERGDKTEFDCYAASQEAQYDDVRKLRWSNFDLLRAAEKGGGSDAMYKLISDSLKYAFHEHGKKPEVRIHESGDFYNQKYLDAWVKVAKSMPNVLFYAYSKSIPYFKKYYSGDDSAVFPTANFIITFSEGGKFDKDLENLDVKVSKVFKSPEEVLAAGLKVDLDDELAKVSGGRDSSFALLIHGTQAAGLNARMKLRNETFLAYWKYRPYLNSVFNKPDENVWGSVESIPIIQSIQDELKERSLGKRTKNSSIKLENIKTWLKLLRYVVKYENYNFSPELIEIIPDFYQP